MVEKNHEVEKKKSVSEEEPEEIDIVTKKNQ